MIDLTGVTHHPALAEITDLICARTQNPDKSFFKGVAVYFFGQIASTMRASIKTIEPGELPISIFSLALGPSGFGKTRSVHIFQEELLKGFRRRFLKNTLDVVAKQNFWVMAAEKALDNGTDPQEEFDKLQAAYDRQGVYRFNFRSGTPAGLDQQRHKLLLSGAAAINYELDEVGSNLKASVELLNMFMELYDLGLIKGKLNKNTTDNPRDEDLEGCTPTNLLLFGTPSKLFDGHDTEDVFYALLEAGYARRCFFSNGLLPPETAQPKSGAEILAEKKSKGSNDVAKKWAARFHELADPAMFNWKMTMDDEVSILMLDYKLACEKAANALPDIDLNQVRKAEMSHRYFKALKLAGAYAFIDKSSEIEVGHLKQAILLAEESGESFQSIVYREKPHVRLGKYLASCGEAVTQHDLMQAVSSYAKGGLAFRKDTMNLACSWGYKNNVIIKKSMVGDIEFFKAETLKVTDLSKLKVSLSTHWAYSYESGEIAFEELHTYTQESGLHWCNHAFKSEHRAEENAIPGFNLIVLDVDGEVSLNTAHELLKDYKFMTYTTKRHTEEVNRFRLVLPINYQLELDATEYKELINSVMSWMPFKTDESANQRSKKWMSCETGSYFYNTQGDTFDILPFIPKTSKNDEYRKAFKGVASLDNLERWFKSRIEKEGNCNNELFKYAMILADNGLDLMGIESEVFALNDKLEDPMDQTRIRNSILVTVAKRLQQRAA